MKINYHIGGVCNWTYIIDTTYSAELKKTTHRIVVCPSTAGRIFNNKW